MQIISFYYSQGIIMFIFSQIIVSAKNPIHRIASQILLFLSGASMFLQFDIYFLGLSYIVVYVGAIAILFLFVIMLIEHPSLGYNYDINNSYKSNKGNASKKKEFSENIQAGSIMRGLNKYLKKVKNIYLKKREEAKANKMNEIDLTNATPFILIFGFNYINETFYDNQLLVIIGKFFKYLYSKYQILMSYFESYEVNTFNYFYTNWTIEFKTITDIETQGIMIYISYPIIQIQVSIALWTVMIGIISICSPKK